MSPEIRVNGKLIADVPDETGVYAAEDGSSLLVYTDEIDALGNKQQTILRNKHMGRGLRTIGLTLEGIGSSANIKKGGDGNEPVVDVVLHDRPIRVTYSPRVWVNDEHLTGGPGSYYYEDRVTRHNPRWERGHGQQ